MEAYARQFPGYFTEAYSDPQGTWFGGGRVDIGNVGTSELWDIKPDNAIGIFAGRVQVEFYTLMSSTFGPNTYEAGGVPGFMGPSITLPGQFASYTFTFSGDGVITYQSQLYSQYELVPLSVPKIIPIPSPAPLLRILPVLP